MFEHIDLSVSEDVERMRRSIVMLTPGQPALRREDALRLLDVLLAQLANRQPEPPPQ